MKGGFRTILAGASLAIMGASFAIPSTRPKSRPAEDPANVAPEPGHTRTRFGRRAKLRQAHAERVAEMADDPWRWSVELLTNHERNRWARAGYPGLQGKNVKQLEKWLRQHEAGRAA